MPQLQYLSSIFTTASKNELHISWKKEFLKTLIKAAQKTQAAGVQNKCLFLNILVGTKNYQSNKSGEARRSAQLVF